MMNTSPLLTLVLPALPARPLSFSLRSSNNNNSRISTLHKSSHSTSTTMARPRQRPMIFTKVISLRTSPLLAPRAPSPPSPFEPIHRHQGRFSTILTSGLENRLPSYPTNGPLSSTAPTPKRPRTRTSSSSLPSSWSTPPRHFPFLSPRQPTSWTSKRLSKNAMIS